MSTILGDVTWTFDGLNVEDCDKTGATFPSDISMVDYQWSGSMNSLSTMGDPLSNEDYNLTRFSSAAHTTIVPDWTKANKLMTSNSGEITASDGKPLVALSSSEAANVCRIERTVVQAQSSPQGDLEPHLEICNDFK